MVAVALLAGTVISDKPIVATSYLAAVTALAIFALIPRKVTTSFDLRDDRVVHVESVGIDALQRRRDYSFVEVKGIAIEEQGNDDGFRYQPYLYLRDGSKRRLCAVADSYLAFSDAIDGICAASGLRRL